MKQGWDIFWLLRLRCRMIARAEAVRPNEMHIKLCERWRWHVGACR